MSKVAIKGADTGTGVFTLESPATNTDRTLTIPDVDGSIVTADASGNVGIGTSSTGRPLHVYHATDNGMALFESGDSAVYISFKDNNTSGDLYNRIGATGDDLQFYTNNLERSRINSSGNFLVGTTVGRSNLSGCTVTHGQISNDGMALFSADGKQPLDLNRLTSDGSIAIFRKDGTTVGSIGSFVGDLTIGDADVGIRFDTGAGLVPWNVSTNAATDNAIDIGALSARFDDIYATNGTIQTSDRNEKQDIEVLSEAEARVAVACKGLLRKFRWKDSVTEKGDEARIHFGIIAQDLQDAFAAEGLDAGRYAMFISSTWWEAERVVPAVEEVLNDEGNVVTEAVAEHTVVDSYQSAEEAPEGATERTRLGVRYPELLAFIIGAI